VLRQGATVETICKVIHKDLVNQFKYALVWGSSTKHSPQKCGLGNKHATNNYCGCIVSLFCIIPGHALEDEDVVMICKK
jgi:ribosome-interacting GTPase 1